MAKKELVQGNEAIAIAALDAGMEFYSGYPITPASEIMHYLSSHKGIAFIQAEDELASANMCIGASLAGKKSMTATSGPGFSLMQESIGFAHATRTPFVIVDSQRVGPSTGMPTMPSQGDLLQAKHGSHGDYVSVVFYPNSVEELYSVTVQAFNASEACKIPVILLSDATLSHMYESVSLADRKKKISLVKRKEKPLGKGNRHITGLLSKDNIPLTKDSSYYNLWFNNYKNDILENIKDYELFEYIENQSSDFLLVSFGFISRFTHSLKDKYSLFRPIRLFPILPQIKEIADNYKKVLVVEMNDGQYASELRQLLGDKVISVSLLGGKVDLNEINKKIKEALETSSK